MTSSLPLVSIITSCYNHEKFVGQALHSALSQTYANVEMLVIDDGSKDSSAEVIEALSAKHGFYFERQSNKGLVPTLNKLLAMCHGKYVALLASDDLFLPEKIEKQVAFMEANPEVGACYGALLRIAANGDLLPSISQSGVDKVTYYSFDDILLQRSNLPIAGCFFRMEMLHKIGYFDENYKMEDDYLSLKIAANGYPIAALPEVVCYYRMHENNLHKNVAFMHNETVKLLGLYSKHPLYKQAMKVADVKNFYRTAVSSSLAALPLLPRAISFNKFFLYGLIALVLPKALLKKLL
jgi:alpha-1,3-rhamnosyltransferase